MYVCMYVCMYVHLCTMCAHARECKNNVRVMYMYVVYIKIKLADTLKCP